MLKPPPHVLEHADQALKEVTSQSTGQKWVLHALFSCRCLHAMPPFAGCCVMVRLRVAVPPPHDREHWDHAAKELCTQCVGHGVVEQWSKSSNCTGQALPP
jgi:hypothetical protein